METGTFKKMLEALGFVVEEKSMCDNKCIRIRIAHPSKQGSIRFRTCLPPSEENYNRLYQSILKMLVQKALGGDNLDLLQNNYQPIV